ncbi:GNAT family N-acetyltransferase [Flavobacterium branchiophilum]|uniref:GNAT family N-acetyltransferase n=1 Tax=Flavobacterium branchiophilum TaxID=55197 RepID=A0A2H3KGA3_9FLAO|nr:GNAT family N-acetyltransferase [Flavobacterium branchiophilum]PDS26718.1 GNAT family N-acetyltransferase [Flavobacterium branchiophilum]
METVQWEVKPFEALTVFELYEILQLRSEIFVVEQNCVYQDLDFKDYKSWHLMGKINHQVVAYSRLFDAGQYFEFASIGRVTVNAQYRAMKMGHALIVESKKQIKNLFGTTNITISAQLYLKKFYEQHGFVATSDVYLEDDIEHVEMKLSSNWGV